VRRLLSMKCRRMAVFSYKFRPAGRYKTQSGNLSKAR